MRRVVTGGLVLITLVCLAAGGVLASDLDALWMSEAPEGPAQTDFPSGTQTVYAVFEYTGFLSEEVRVVVTDYRGDIVYEETETFSGTGTASVPVTYEQAVFPDGLYVTTLYFAGQYLTRAVEWTVGGVDMPTTPTPLPPARLEVEPTTLTFSAQQGGSNPSTQRVLISNSTAAASAWSATARAPWLQLDAEGGETPALLRVGVDSTRLPAATYTAQIVISADGIDGSPQTVDVSLDIASPDEATTLDLPAVAQGTGWVASDEPADNHFDADEIRVGLQAGTEYQGGLQFDLSAIHAESPIRAAAVVIPGLRWETQPSGGDWVLELIDQDLADEWASHGYAEIAGAVARAQLVPDHSVDNLGPASESVWYLDTGGLDILESFVGEGKSGVMRLRYEPASDEDVEDGLFVWSEGGVLRVNFEPVVEPFETPTPVSTSETPLPATVTPSPSSTNTPTAETATASPTVTDTPAASATATATPTPAMPPPPPGNRKGGVTMVGLVWALTLFGAFGMIVRRLWSFDD